MRLQKTMYGTAIAVLSCAAYLGAGYAPAAAAPAVAETQTKAETPASLALSPVTITDHDETLTMLLPAQISEYKKEEQSFAEIGFTIGKYLARAEGAGLDVLVQHTVFGDAGDSAAGVPTLDEAVAGARDAIAAAYQYDQMMRDERIDLGGMPGHLFSYAYTVGGTRYIDDSVVVTLGCNQWNITLSRRADNKTAAPHMNEILSSIRVGAAQ